MKYEDFAASKMELMLYKAIAAKRADVAESLAAGASKTMNSRHITGHAVDLAPTVEGKIRWDWPLFRLLAPAMKQAAQDLVTPLIWGGDWKTFKDGPHFELDRRKYP